MLFATIYAAFCALHVNTIQANETPVIRLKDVHTTQLAQIGFLLQSPMTATVHWNADTLHSLIIAPSHAEFTEVVSPSAANIVQVIASDSFGTRGYIIFSLVSLKYVPTHLGTLSLFSDSPHRAMLRQGEEFVLNLIAERSFLSNAPCSGNIKMYGMRNTFGNFAALALEVGTDVMRKFNDQVQCYISTKQKPENTVRVETKCYISGIPIGNTDKYTIAITIDDAYFFALAEIEGNF
ncbi:hypothetical protein CAPTEDRAFT_198439 [Capitella teleta]|uniref:IgGFc-binding protein N-terminal domain-containing protein n=1 Tax=Capitella teleta TaxID=283909 RepID=R7TW27_CAPTE|nr:hypothetical protein CAPTEDRAFT_198439 [Capitella teleta]|eukprot:ELT97919.1 hypothetical protein CAPTEDRAFT_198439 [Capitella teleta]